MFDKNIVQKGCHSMDLKVRRKFPSTTLGLAIIISFIMMAFYYKPVHAAGYSPYDIESKVYKERWDVNGDNGYSSTSGKRLHYDVYKGGGSSNKTGYKIETKDFGKGKEKFLTFTGWAAIVGYTHHNSDNQSTYIMAVNDKSGKEKFYRAQMTSLDASKDIEYNRTSATGPINNRCPNGTYNKVNNSCNMDYKSVGFKAWLPLGDLFPDENKGGEWELYIVKRVGTGSKMNVVYDKLITPFEFEDKKFQAGTITLSSGVEAKKLKMLVSDAVRRSAPRSTDNRGNYFKEGKTYNYAAHSEKYTMIWYGVNSPEDNNATRYAGSLYWRSLGKQATLTYDVSLKSCPDGSKVPQGHPCTVSVTIKHKDIDSGKVLDTEIKKSTVGKMYSYVPKKKGTYSTNGVPYSAYPAGQKFTGKTPDKNLSFTFTYRAVKDEENPNDNVKVVLVNAGGTGGKASGHTFWELRRTDSTKPAQLYVEADYSIAGTHYKTRNPQVTVTSKNIAKSATKTISFTTNAADLKGEQLSYDFTYEYTNYYRDYYIKDWFYVKGDKKKPGYWDWKWKYDHRETAWDKGEIFSLEGEKEEPLYLDIDHSQQEAFTFETMGDMKDVELIVGRRHNWTNNTLTLNKTYYEKFSKPSASQASSTNKLHEQTFLNMEPDRVSYEIELPSDEQKKAGFSPLLKQGSSGLYYPADIDVSLQKHYALDENYVPGQNAKKVEKTDTKYVTAQTSADYSDDEGYTGKLVPYLYTIDYGKEETKFVTNQPSADYDDGEYKGPLTPYVASGAYTPEDTKTVTQTIKDDVTCTWVWNGSDWEISVKNNLLRIPYDKEGYKGTLELQSDLAELMKETKPVKVGAENEKVEVTKSVSLDYEGDVTKPAEDTRVFRYEGTVSKKGEEKREIRYQGYVSKVVGSETEEATDTTGLFAFPLQMSQLNPIGLNGNSKQFEMRFVTDLFFMSKDFGYIGYYPYAEKVKANLVSGAALPSAAEILSDVTARTSDLFKKQTGGETFEDTFLYTDSSDAKGLYGSKEKLMRYYIPIDAASPLENKMEYPNEIMLENMGLSDVTFQFSQTFSFDLYLEGSVYDEVAYWEQVEPRVWNMDYPFSVTFTPKEQKQIMALPRNNYALHGFRLTDTKRLIHELKKIKTMNFGSWW